MKFVNLRKISLVSYSSLNEKWIQKIIADDPSILGLGDLVLKEQIQGDPGIAWMGFLLQDSDGMKRYEVQLQLGDLDEIRIIRAIEYWDIERKRSPEYQHIPVVVAEKITTRFLNVLSLFGQAIPVIAIKMDALKFGGEVGLHFSTVVDHGLPCDLDVEEESNPIVDRLFWEKKSSKEVLDLVDRYHEIAKGFDPELELEFTKGHIALRNKESAGFMSFRPCGDLLEINLSTKKSPLLDRRFEDAGLEVTYCSIPGCYSISFEVRDFEKIRDLIVDGIKAGYATVADA